MSDLVSLRTQINKIDKELIDLLDRRMMKCRAIMRCKDVIFDSEREADVVRNMRSSCVSVLSKDDIDEFAAFVLQMSKMIMKRR